MKCTRENLIAAGWHESANLAQFALRHFGVNTLEALVKAWNAAGNDGRGRIRTADIMKRGGRDVQPTKSELFARLAADTARHEKATRRHAQFERVRDAGVIKRNGEAVTMRGEAFLKAAQRVADEVDNARSVMEASRLCVEMTYGLPVAGRRTNCDNRPFKAVKCRDWLFLDDGVRIPARSRHVEWSYT